jgi:hypothetical protein
MEIVLPFGLQVINSLDANQERKSSRAFSGLNN